MLCSALRPKIKIRCSNPMVSIVLFWCDVMINDWYYQDFKIQKDSSQHITAALNNFNIPQSGLVVIFFSTQSLTSISKLHTYVV